ncbi:hypothetical protein [Aquibacillus halophilus]|nr:hypothetical protein [Aquibacillus halophilus]
MISQNLPAVSTMKLLALAGYTRKLGSDIDDSDQIVSTKGGVATQKQDTNLAFVCGFHTGFLVILYC